MTTTKTAAKFERTTDGRHFTCLTCYGHGDIPETIQYSECSYGFTGESDSCRRCAGTGLVQCEADCGPAVEIDADQHGGPIPLCQKCIDEMAAVLDSDLQVAAAMARTSRLMESMLATRGKAAS
jgi:hypothetical protein